MMATTGRIYKTYQGNTICVNENACKSDWMKLIGRICNKTDFPGYWESIDGKTVFCSIFGKKYRFDFIQKSPE